MRERLSDDHPRRIQGYCEKWLAGNFSREIAKEEAALVININAYNNAKCNVELSGLPLGKVRNSSVAYDIDEYLFNGVYVMFQEKPKSHKVAGFGPEFTIDLMANSKEQLRKIARKLKLPLEKRVAQR